MLVDTVHRKAEGRGNGSHARLHASASNPREACSVETVVTPLSVVNERGRNRGARLKSCARRQDGWATESIARYKKRVSRREIAIFPSIRRRREDPWVSQT